MAKDFFSYLGVPFTPQTILIGSVAVVIFFRIKNLIGRFSKVIKSQILTVKNANQEFER